MLTTTGEVFYSALFCLTTIKGVFYAYDHLRSFILAPLWVYNFIR